MPSVNIGDQANIGPARDVVPVVSAGNFAEGLSSGLLLSASASVDIVTASGVTRSGVPLQAGYNPVFVRGLAAMPAGVTIFALY